MTNANVKVAVIGAAGRMGRALIEAVSAGDGVEIAAAIDRPGNSLVGADVGDDQI